VTSEDAATKRLIQPLALAESAAYVLIGIVFLAMTVETLWQLVRSVLIDINLGGNITAELVDSLNEALFVIILLELLSTVVNHLRKGGLQLRRSVRSNTRLDMRAKWKKKRQRRLKRKRRKMRQRAK
jgi:hypothetical protein